MSAEDIQIVKETLETLLLSDNKLRREGEIKLESLMLNKSALSYCLSHILTTSQDLNVLTYAAVILRKLLDVKKDEVISPVWKESSAELKDFMKKNIIIAISGISNKNLKIKTCNVACQIATNCFENDEAWNEILQYIIQGFTLDLTDDNIMSIECAVYLLANIFPTSHEELSKAIDVFIKGFTLFFSTGNLSLKTRSTQAIIEILCGALKKKESKKFREFVFYILETTLQCLEQGDENNLKICLTSISDLAQAEPGILRKSFNDLYILMGKVIEKKDLLEDTVREIAYEILVELITKKPALISKDTEKLQLLAQSIFKYSMEIDSTIDEDWCIPKTESFFDEDFVPEGKLDEALSLIDRLVNAIGKETMLKLISDIVMELLNHASSDWKYKYIAYMTIANISKYVNDINAVDTILGLIFKDTENENPKIRYACLYCIAEMSENLNPDFQKNYHQNVFTCTNQRIKSDSVLRVTLQACSALQAFIAHCPESIATGAYVQGTLDACFITFLKSDQEVPISLREGLLDVISEIVSSSQKEFLPYAEKCLTILVSYLGEILKSNTNKSLFGMILEVISIIGPLCEDIFQKYIPDIVTTLIEIQNNISTFKDPVAPYLQSTWEKIIPMIKSSFHDIAVKIIESTLKVIKNTPEMSVSSQPEKKFDIQQFLAELNSDQKVSIEKTKITVTTSETEEYAAFLELIVVLISQYKEIYLPYVELTQKEIIPLINFPNEEIRSNASNCLPDLLDVIKLNLNTQVLHECAKFYLSELIKALDSEIDNGVISTFLDNINGIIEKAGLFLTTPEINILCAKLLSIFDKVEKSRIELLQEKAKVEDEFEKEKEAGDNKIYSDDEGSDSDNEQILQNMEDEIEEIENVLVSYADVIGILFKTHKDLTLEIVNRLLNELLPKYFLPKASNFEKKMGLFIIDDMVEFLGQELINDIWLEIAKSLVIFADNKIPELRQAACYGLGEFAKHTVKDFNIYANDCLAAVSRACDLTQGDNSKDEWGHAKDNAISALGKIIKYQGLAIDLSIWVPKWVGFLPISYDAKEGPGSHTLLCEILLSQPQLILGSSNENLTKVIRILAKIYNCENFSNEECNQKILQIFQNIKANPSLNNFIEQAKQGCDPKIRTKLDEHFP